MMTPDEVEEAICQAARSRAAGNPYQVITQSIDDMVMKSMKTDNAPTTDSYGREIRVGDLMVLGVHNPHVGVVAEVTDRSVTLRDEMVLSPGRGGVGAVWEAMESRPWNLTGILPATGVVVDSVDTTRLPVVGDVVVSNSLMLSVVTGTRDGGNTLDLWHLDLEGIGVEHVASCVVVGMVPWL